MLFMVIERFKNCDGLAVYGRIRQREVPLPEGLTIKAGWIEPNFNRCFQIMECDDISLFQHWILDGYNDLIDFEIVPVMTTKDTRALISPFLDKAGYKQNPVV